VTNGIFNTQENNKGTHELTYKKHIDKSLIVYSNHRVQINHEPWLALFSHPMNPWKILLVLNTWSIFLNLNWNQTHNLNNKVKVEHIKIAIKTHGYKTDISNMSIKKSLKKQYFQFGFDSLEKSQWDHGDLSPWSQINNFSHNLSTQALISNLHIHLSFFTKWSIQLQLLGSIW
jgi:hypothetical protein